jgi:hypothetical protein
MNIVKIKCNECGIEFDKSIYEINRKQKLGKTTFFCSIGCGTKFQIKHRVEQSKTEYSLNPKKCANCYSIIPYEYRGENRFCGHSCAAKMTNSYRKQKAKAVNKCQFCGKIGVNKKYCNNICQSNDRKRIIFDRIESGEKVFYSQYKKYLLNKRGNKCEMCGLTEWGGFPVLLIMDHIDGNADNNDLKNLRLICSNCDTLTPTYKGRNKGCGRFLRRQKYKDGKSF